LVEGKNEEPMGVEAAGVPFCEEERELEEAFPIVRRKEGRKEVEKEVEVGVAIEEARLRSDSFLLPRLPYRPYQSKTNKSSFLPMPTSSPPPAPKPSQPKQQQQPAKGGGRARETSARSGGGPSLPIKLKIVVRRLPPNLPEQLFWKSVEPWVSEETAGWRDFKQGKLAKT